MTTEVIASTEGAPQGATTETATASPGTGDTPGFPANTAVIEMTAEQQAAYWKAQSRKHETRVKATPSPEELKRLRDDAAELEKLRHASMGEQERAVEAARNETRDTIAREFALRLVAAEFRAATAGRVTRDDLDEFLEPMDLSKFIGDNGDVDTAKVIVYAEKMAPKSGAKFPDLGQGARRTTAKPSLASGRAAYEARHGKPTDDQ